MRGHAWGNALNPDFRDMLSALSDAGADYLLVAAYANRIDILTSIAA